MMLTKHEETKFMEKAERNIPRIDVFAGGLFLEVHVLFVSVFLRVGHGAWHKAGDQ